MFEKTTRTAISPQDEDEDHDTAIIAIFASEEMSCVVFPFCDPLTLSRLRQVCRESQARVDSYMNSVVDAILYHGGNSFRWKNGYGSDDISLHIRPLFAGGDREENNEAHDHHNDAFNIISDVNQPQDLLQEYIERNGILNLANNNTRNDETPKMEHATRVDFSDRLDLVNFILQLLLVANISEDNDNVPLYLEEPDVRANFVSSISNLLLEQDFLRNGDENSYSSTWEISLSCNEHIVDDREAVMDEFFQDFAPLKNRLGQVTQLAEYVLHKRCLVSSLLRRAVVIRKSCFAIEDDTHAGFGPYYRKGTVYMLELENGAQCRIYGYSYFDGPYS